jgi:hypothetical protein
MRPLALRLCTLITCALFIYACAITQVLIPMGSGGRNNDNYRATAPAGAVLKKSTQLSKLGLRQPETSKMVIDGNGNSLDKLDLWTYDKTATPSEISATAFLIDVQINRYGESFDCDTWLKQQNVASVGVWRQQLGRHRRLRPLDWLRLNYAPGTPASASVSFNAAPATPLDPALVLALARSILLAPK